MTDVDKHEEARRLTEKALDQLELGHEPEADKLIEKAKKLDPGGAAEVVADLNEDAATQRGRRDTRCRHAGVTPFEWRPSSEKGR